MTFRSVTTIRLGTLLPALVDRLFTEVASVEAWSTRGACRWMTRISRLTVKLWWDQSNILRCRTTEKTAYACLESPTDWTPSKFWMKSLHTSAVSDLFDSLCIACLWIRRAGNWYLEYWVQNISPSRRSSDSLAKTALVLSWVENLPCQRLSECLQCDFRAKNAV